VSRARDATLAGLRDAHAQAHSSLLLSRAFLIDGIGTRESNLRAIKRYRAQRRALATAIALIEREPARVQ
jgi:hypothetical protein